MEPAKKHTEPTPEAVKPWLRLKKEPSAWEQQAARVIGKEKKPRKLRPWVYVVAALFALGLWVSFCILAVLDWLG